MKTTVSEAEHPLLCEGTRRVKGDLALALMITYKDDQCKLKKVKNGFTFRNLLTGTHSFIHSLDDDMQEVGPVVAFLPKDRPY